MLTAMFAALAVLTPPGFKSPASRSVVRLGTHAGGEVSASTTKTALRAPPNLWGTELATHGLRVQAGSATMGAAPADTRPPREKYATQLQQIKDMGFADEESIL